MCWSQTVGPTHTSGEEDSDHSLVRVNFRKRQPSCSTTHYAPARKPSTPNGRTSYGLRRVTCRGGDTDRPLPQLPLRPEEFTPLGPNLQRDEQPTGPPHNPRMPDNHPCLPNIDVTEETSDPVPPRRPLLKRHKKPRTVLPPDEPGAPDDELGTATTPEGAPTSPGSRAGPGATRRMSGRSRPTRGRGSVRRTARTRRPPRATPGTSAAR